MAVVTEGKFRNYEVIIAPDKIVIPENFSIVRTARTGNPDAYQAAVRMELAEALAACLKKISNV